MRSPKKILFFAVALVAATSTFTHAQKGKGGDNAHREVHQSLSAVESEIRRLIDQNEAYVKAALNRSEELKKLNRDLSRADKDDRQKLTNRIQDLSHEERIQSLQSQLNSVAIQRLNLELQTLDRQDEHLIEGGGNNRGGRLPAQAPQVRSINVLKEERSGQNRITRIYEVIFSDGSRQRVESKEHVDPRR